MSRTRDQSYRWRIQLAEYNYTITYKRGSQNTIADALSRIGVVSKKHYRSDEFDEDGKKQISINFMTVLRRP